MNLKSNDTIDRVKQFSIDVYETMEQFFTLAGCVQSCIVTASALDDLLCAAFDGRDRINVDTLTEILGGEETVEWLRASFDAVITTAEALKSAAKKLQSIENTRLNPEFWITTEPQEK